MLLGVGVQINAALDVRSLKRALGELGKRTSRTALNRSLGRARQVMKTEAKRGVARELNVRQRDITKSIKTKLYPSRGEAELVISGPRIPLIDFKGTRGSRSRGVSFKVKPSGARQRLRRAFIATMDSGHRGVFERDLGKVKKRRPPKYAGLAIREKVGTTVVRAVDKPTFRYAVIGRGREVFQAELDRQLSLARTKRGGF